MSKTETSPWSIQDSLQTPEDLALYLEAVFEDGDPLLIAAALGDIARSRGMSELARQTGLSRQNLYRALSPDGHPEFATVLKVMRALNLKLTVAVDLETPANSRTPSDRVGVTCSNMPEASA